LPEEDKIGTILSCNVIVQELENGKIEVAVVNPMASMHEVNNKDLDSTAKEIGYKLKQVDKIN